MDRMHSLTLLSSEPVIILGIHRATRLARRIARTDCYCGQCQHDKSKELVSHYRSILCNKRFSSAIIFQIYISFSFMIAVGFFTILLINW